MIAGEPAAGRCPSGWSRGPGFAPFQPFTALRLERATGMDAEFWLGLQTDRDLWHELQSPCAIPPPHAARHR